LTKKQNAAGIYAIEYFIRGKPWTIAIDDYILIYNQADYYY
jgi:hypothetical protein